MVQSEEPELGTCFLQTWSWITPELVSFEEILQLSAALLVVVGPISNVLIVERLVVVLTRLLGDKRLWNLTETLIYAERLIFNFYLVYLILFKSLIGAWPVLEVIIALMNMLDYSVLYIFWPNLQSNDYVWNGNTYTVDASKVITRLLLTTIFTVIKMGLMMLLSN